MKKQTKKIKYRPGFIISVSIIFLIVFFAILRGSQESTYKIYKTECRNHSVEVYSAYYIENRDNKFAVTFDYSEIPTLDKYKIGRAIQVKWENYKNNGVKCYLSSSANEYFVLNYTEDLITYSTKRLILNDCYQQKEVCEDVEVEELLISSTADWNCPEKYFTEALNCKIYNIGGAYENCEKEYREKYCIPKITNFSKQAINKEWLSENCKCSNSSCDGFNVLTNAKGEQVCFEIDNSVIYGKCLEWSCGDYRVVKK